MRNLSQTNLSLLLEHLHDQMRRATCAYRTVIPSTILFSGQFYEVLQRRDVQTYRHGQHIWAGGDQGNGRQIFLRVISQRFFVEGWRSDTKGPLIV